MKPGYTVIVNAAAEGGYWATCPEVPAANGQGESVEEAEISLRKAIEMLKGHLDQLVDRITPANLHDEIDWGQSMGREAL